MGTLCVVDFASLDFPYEKIELLKTIARQVITQLELRKRIIDSDKDRIELKKSLDEANISKMRSEILLKNIFPILWQTNGRSQIR